MRILSWLAGAAFGLAASSAMAACGGMQVACQLPSGQYHILLPDGAAGPVPAVMFLHGAGGTGAGVMRNGAMCESLLARGYALIAPSGLSRTGRNGGFWAFHAQLPGRRDEAAFFRDVAADSADRHGVDRDRIILAGFSIGGSTVSYQACAAPDAFAAYAPVAGSFWRPHPDSCAGPVRLFHTHGWTDGTVPLEGRPLRNGTIYQGDVFHAMSIWRDANGCDRLRADGFDMSQEFWHRRWDNCVEGSALEFVLFPGGHRVPQSWADAMLDWFEALPQP